MLTVSRKSQLAIEHCYRTMNSSPNCWVFWIHASSPARLDAGTRELADILRLPGRHDPGTNVLRLVENWLRGSGNQWLLVLDNADVEDVLFKPVDGVDAGSPIVARKRTIDFLAIPSCGQTILTTRHKKVAAQFVDECDIIAVGPMIKPDANALFRSKAGAEHDSRDAERLVDELGNIPLAIVHAAAFIRSKVPPCPIQTYLIMLRESIKSDASLLTANFDELRRDPEADNSVINTWQVSFEHIRQTRPSAADRLSLMSFYDHRSIPRALIQSQRFKDTVPTHSAFISEAGPLTRTTEPTRSIESPQNMSTKALESATLDVELDDDIALLYNFHLISVKIGSDNFELHPLVQLAARKWIKSRGAENDWLAKSIERLVHALPRDPSKDTPRWRALLPHIQVASTSEPQDKTSRISLATIYYQASWYLVFSGEVQACEIWRRRCWVERKYCLGDDNYDTLSAAINLVKILKMTGKTDEALAMLKHSLILAEQYENSDHEGRIVLVRCLQALGDLRMTRGQLADAEINFRRAITYLDGRSGQDGFPDVVKSLVELLMRQRNYVEAESLCRDSLQRRTNTDGKEHNYSLRMSEKLAEILRHQGKLVEALKLNNSVLESYQRMFGVDDFRSLNTMRAIAIVLREQEKIEESVDLYKQIYHVSMNRYGKENMITPMFEQDYALALKEAHKDDQALEIMRSCATILLRMLGPDHEITSRSTQCVATWERELRDAHTSQIAQKTFDAQERQDEPKKQTRRRKRDKCVAQ